MAMAKRGRGRRCFMEENSPQTLEPLEAKNIS